MGKPKKKIPEQYKFGKDRHFEGYRYSHSTNHRNKSSAKHESKRIRKDYWSRVVKRGKLWAVYKRRKGLGS